MAIQEKLVSNGLKWIDVLNPTQMEMDELSQQFQLNQHIVRDCLQPEHLPKYEYDEENNVDFLILRFFSRSTNLQIGSMQELTDKIAIFGTENFLITIHIEETPFLEPIARHLNMTKKPVSFTELLAKIIWHTLETYDAPAEKLSAQVDIFEDQVLLKRANNDVSEALYYVKRQASISHKVLMLMVEPINHINAKEGEKAVLQDVRDQHLKMQTLYSQILDDVNTLLSLSMSFAEQRTNEVMRILTLFSVFFMPLTFIVGIYGMNFDFMPELNKKWGYPAVLLLMVIVTATIYFWFRRKKWLS